MPRQLYVFRHAKSSWADTALRDFERPLANRGLKAAPRMGQLMADYKIAPDLILCSTSRRTRETLGLVLPFLEGECRILMENGIYEVGSEATLIERLRQLPGSIARAMVIGHNPVMQDLTIALSGSAANQDDLSAVREKFPTAGLAVIDLADTPWLSLAPGCGSLSAFWRPRQVGD